MATGTILSVVISLGLSLLLTPLVIRLAHRIGAVDQPDERKIHKRPTPRLGGLAPFVSFALTLVILHFALPQTRLQGLFAQSSWWMITFSLVSIVLLGVYDDVWPMRPGKKFLVQFMAGTFVYLAGFRIETVTDPFSAGTFHFGFLSYPLTVFWMVGITNAFNLIDGLDGLASGISIIAAVTIAAIAALHGDITTVVTACALAGAVLGFLKYNFNPARVFLGDSGSLFLGFSLAVLSIQSSAKGSTAFSLIVPILALGVPILDTSLAMMRRIFRSFLPGESTAGSLARQLHAMFLPDRRHIHHQLLARGLSQKEAVFLLYVVSCTFGLCAFLVTTGSLNASLILVGVGITAVVAVKKLGYREMALLRNGVLLNLYKKTFVQHLVSFVLLDVASIVASMFLAMWFGHHGNDLDVDMRTVAFSVATVCVVQFFGLLQGGLYRRTITLLGLGDLLQLLKATLLSTLAAACVLRFLPLIHDKSGLGMLALFDFYFLATLIIGSRVAFHAMNYIARRNVKDGRKAIIYGADSNGLLTMHSLLSGNAVDEHRRSSALPVGFLDDDPAMEGKFLDGYPVFGGHWKLEGLLNRMDISEIVLANPNISTATLSRVQAIADSYHVPIRFSKFRLEPVSRVEHGTAWAGTGQRAERTYAGERMRVPQNVGR